MSIWKQRQNSFLHGATRGVFACALTTVMGMPSANAVSVYRYIDDEGVVAYAAEPPTAGHHYQIIEVDNDINAEEKIAAEKQRDRLLAEAAQLDAKQRTADTKRTAGLRDARIRLAGAEKAARDAAVTQDADWQHLARGGRHLKPEYFIRVDEARKTVSRAKDELRALLAHKK